MNKQIKTNKIINNLMNEWVNKNQNIWNNMWEVKTISNNPKWRIDEWMNVYIGKMNICMNM